MFYAFQIFVGLFAASWEMKIQLTPNPMHDNNFCCCFAFRFKNHIDEVLEASPNDNKSFPNTVSKMSKKQQQMSLRYNTCKDGIRSSQNGCDLGQKTSIPIL